MHDAYTVLLCDVRTVLLCGIFSVCSAALQSGRSTVARLRSRAAAHILHSKQALLKPHCHTTSSAPKKSAETSCFELLPRQMSGSLFSVSASLSALL